MSPICFKEFILFFLNTNPPFLCLWTGDVRLALNIKKVTRCVLGKILKQGAGIQFISSVWDAIFENHHILCP